MGAIPPNTYLDGFKQSMCDGIDGAFKKGVKYGRYLEQQERPARTDHTWINVKDRLPGTTGLYLVSIHCPKGDWIEVNRYDDGDWLFDSSYHRERSTEFVTHWMRLPEPPKPTT